jgi:hypothetical protein
LAPVSVATVMPRSSATIRALTGVVARPVHRLIASESALLVTCSMTSAGTMPRMVTRNADGNSG